MYNNLKEVTQMISGIKMAANDYCLSEFCESP